MFGLHEKALVISLPIFTITCAVSMLFFSFLFDSSKWFKDLKMSYFVTMSLMVGDHVIDTLNSIQGYGIKFLVLSKLSGPLKYFNVLPQKNDYFRK